MSDDEIGVIRLQAPLFIVILIFCRTKANVLNLKVKKQFILFNDNTNRRKGRIRIPKNT